jgi:endonuclease/exonuclease/phosphatase (EEP) superfamily protein YafD
VLLSKHPIEAVRLGERSDATIYSYVANRAIEATLPDGTSIILTAMHPYSPRTSGKWRTSLMQVERDAKVLASAQRRFAAPILVAADHNSTPMGMLHRRFRHMTGMSTRSNPFAGTWPAKNPTFFAFPIDRVWASPEVRFVRSSVGPAFRSDHRPVVVDLRIPARSAAQPTASEPQSTHRELPDP